MVMTALLTTVGYFTMRGSAKVPTAAELAGVYKYRANREVKTPYVRGKKFAELEPYSGTHHTAKLIADGKAPSLPVPFKPQAALPTPEPLARRKWIDYSDPELTRTLNSVTNENSSMFYYPDPKKLYDKMVSGDLIPSLEPNLYHDSGYLGCFHGSMRRQLTTEDALLSIRHPVSMTKWLMKTYKIKNPSGFFDEFGARVEKYPGGELDWRMDVRAGKGWGSLHRLPANTEAVIKRYRHNESVCESRAIDKGFLISVSDTYLDRYTVANPHNGAFVQHTLSRFTDPTFQELVHMGKTHLSDEGKPRLHCQTIQQAIATCEALGFNWRVEYWRNNAVEADRHKLYAHNFPYRGMVKHPYPPKKDRTYIRQQGSDTVRSDGEHPYIINHFKGKTAAEIFA